jgi:hypothetical protein
MGLGLVIPHLWPNNPVEWTGPIAQAMVLLPGFLPVRRRSPGALMLSINNSHLFTIVPRIDL